MDYEQMSVSELRAESVRRGLGTARSRADLIQRLTNHDAEQQTPEDTVQAPISGPESVIPASAIQTMRITPEAPAAPGVFRKTFDAEPGGPDEETHLAYRQATIQAAIEAGLTPRGDARLADTSGGVWVYEVLVRQAV